MAQIKYTVTASTMDEVAVEAVVDGEKVQARVSRLVIEATSSDGSMGHTFRLGADAKPEDFQVGQELIVTLKPAK